MSSSHEQFPKTYVPGAFPTRSQEVPDVWSSLQSTTTRKWAAALPGRVLNSHTPFAEFLRQTLHADRSSLSAPEGALFPLPIPKVGIFSQKCCGSRERNKRAADRAFHVIVMALNFWHADFKFVPLRALRVQPSKRQLLLLANMKKLFKAFGNCQDEVSIPASGRRSASLLSMLSDLSDFLNWEGLAGDSYTQGFPGAVGGLKEVATVPATTDKAEELVPYRPLCPDRLKITGTAAWDPSEFLDDALWMAFQEPASLKWTEGLPLEDFPDLSKTLQLVKIWDAKNLVSFKPYKDGVPWHEAGCIRFFNCYKSPDVDRMIGDRRIQNWKEGKLPGVSRALPVAPCLSFLEVSPRTERLSICISDRKDFYHQFAVSRQRASSNALWPPLHCDDLHGLVSFSKYAEEFDKGAKERYDRRKHGDGLKEGHVETQKIGSSSSLVQACFSSIPQGDHLGVEIATSSHRNFLKEQGLLAGDREVRSDVPFRGEKVAEGLVIDDYYAISVEKDKLCDRGRYQSEKPLSQACRLMRTATTAYASAGILGSTDKDVFDADHAKVTGGEFDSSEATRRLGSVLLGAPVKKRLALSLLSLELAALRWTSDALHACLIGGWTHVIMYRRQFMSLLSQAYKLAPMDQVDKNYPKLCRLSRAVAQELVLLAVLAPLITCDLAAKMDDVVYASDASEAKGAYVFCPQKEDVVRALWRTGRRKTSYVRLLRREEALVRKLDVDKEEHEFGTVPSADGVVDPERPRAHRFHFIEVCGGSGKVSRALASRGWVVGPVLDLDSSQLYNLRSLKVLSWLLHLLEEGLLDSLAVEPPCTTFSPAQYPASRSYACPRGHNPLEPRTLEGTELALRALTLIFFCAQASIPALLEQPRRTKMRALAEWKFLVEVMRRAYEVWLASCAYGSPHKKEFVFLVTFPEAASLHRKCSRDHSHVRVEGSYTKQSAVYTDQLAEKMAEAFDKALSRRFRQEQMRTPKTDGLEDPLCNDVLLSGRWKYGKAWRWKRPTHINILESASAGKLLKDLALLKPCTRSVIVMDSNVGLSAQVKGRSPSNGLRPSVRRAGAICVVGSLYPSFHFGPTRWNTADCPTRDYPLPEPLLAFSEKLSSLSQLLDFSQQGSLNRQAANWVRLFSLLYLQPLMWKDTKESWRFLQLRFKHYPFALASGFGRLDFDSSLGFPGEGPWLDFLSQSLWIFLFAACQSVHDVSCGFWNTLPLPAWPTGFLFGMCCASLLWIFCRVWNTDFVPLSSRDRITRKPPKLRPLILVALLLFRNCHGVKLDSALGPGDAGDLRRAKLRASMDELPKGRPVLGVTQAYRDKLLHCFDGWLKVQGLDLDALLNVPQPDIDGINLLLERYGRELYGAGRPYNHYAETINGISARRPRIRRSLQQAWDVAYAWLRNEPPIHHVALPWQALLAILVTALTWGWVRVAGVVALSWGAVTRIGEVLSASRRHLVLPADIGNTVGYALLEIQEPKTRFTTARHQAARLDQPQLLVILRMAFEGLSPDQKLWPMSPQTMRTRFAKLLAANGLSGLPSGLSRGIDLGSLRAGGASWLLLTSEDSELTRRRGRWISNRIMEIYVQEISSLQFLPKLPEKTKVQILSGAALFPWCLQKAFDFYKASIPEAIWYVLFKSEAVNDSRADGHDGIGEKMNG